EPDSLTPGSHTDAFAETVDVYPTLCELAGLPAPEVPQAIDGLSLLPVLKDPTQSVRDHAYHAYPRRGVLGRAIRTERYRMVEWQPFNGDEQDAQYELYDYEADELEQVNIADRQPEVLAELKTILNSHPAPARYRGN
ncbi:MAG: sulfatase/phosphatase domain-containing protein, partial [Planctomycetota bacterium]